MKNKILVEFDFLIDMDLGIFRYIKDNYYDHPYIINRDLLDASVKDKLAALITSESCNPLDLIFDTSDTNYDNMYNSITHDIEIEKELLSYSRKSNMFDLMIIYLDEASDVEITVLCKNGLEAELIGYLDPRFKIVIEADKKDVNMKRYDAVYMKHFKNVLDYTPFEGKHVYIANMLCNMDPQDPTTPNIVISVAIAHANILHTIDMYKDVKLKYVVKKGEPDDSQ